MIIKKIKNLFDYMYYRIYKFYYKWDKETGITALIAVSLFQTIILADLILIITTNRQKNIRSHLFR